MKAERQESQESELRTLVKSLDSLLDIVYVEWAGRYSLICNWPQGDARWPMFQNGEIGAAYDSLGWMCKDMSDPSSVPVSLDDIEQLVIERLASCDNTRRDWKSRMADQISHNRKVRDDRADTMLEQVQDVASGLWHIAGKVDNHKLERIMQEVSEGHV
jgi:hypothetical protein